MFHPDLLKVLWLTINLIGVYSVGRNLYNAILNRAFLLGSGMNGELRIEADGNVQEEWVRLSGTIIGIAIGVSVFFIADRPEPDTTSIILAFIIGLGLTYITSVSVIISFLQRRKVAKMLSYRGLDRSKNPPDYYRE